MKLRRPFLLHGLAAIAVMISFITFGSTTLCYEDARVHALWRTFIFHKGGQVVIRQPDNSLFECNGFTHVDPNSIWFVCAVYLLAWVIWMLIRYANRKRRIEPRGFPLD